MPPSSRFDEMAAPIGDVPSLYEIGIGTPSPALSRARVAWREALSALAFLVVVLAIVLGSLAVQSGSSLRWTTLHDAAAQLADCNHCAGSTVLALFFQSTPEQEP
jgi:hypothetical protein